MVGKAAGYHLLRQQGAVFEDVIFEMRFGRLKMWVEGEKQGHGPKAGTYLATWGGRKVAIFRTE